MRPERCSEAVILAQPAVSCCLLHRPPHRLAPLCPQGSEAASKGDFLFSSDHLIEMATKLYRTTLSQTRQKLNIEISDEYVRAVLHVPSCSLVYAAPARENPVCVCRWFRGWVGRE